MKVAGFSLNLLTLFALVLAIGTVVDDAIVVVEAVMTKLEGGSKNVRSAVTDAMSEVTAACISTTLVFMAVFIPVTFMGGTSGTFFKQFGITMASAVGLSAVSALTLCPALCVLMLRPKEDAASGKRKKFGEYIATAYTTSYNVILGKYMKAVTRFIQKPKKTWLLLAAAVAGLMWFMGTAQKDLVPQEDQGFLLVNVALKPGTYLNRTEATTVQLEEYIQTLDEVETVGALTGYSMMDDATSTNYATLMVRLKNWSERNFYSVGDVQEKITEWARVNLPQADITAFQMPQIPGYGNGSNIDLSIQDRTRSADKQGFVLMGEEFLEKLSKRPEVEYAVSNYSRDYPKYKLDVDEIACKRMGISPKTVLNTISTCLAGSYIGSYVQYSNVYRVMVQAGKEYRMSATSLNSIFVPVGGRMVPVTEFVTMTPDMGAAMEYHFNLFPSYPVTVMPAHGYTSDEVFPESFGYEYSGMAREENENANSNETAFIYAICLLLIYLIMACLYDSLLIPLAVLLSIPFGLLGAFIAVKPMELMGVGVNIYVQTGIIMIIGLVAKTAILITEFAVQKRREGMGIREAAIQPLVIGSGAGAVGNKSLALTVIGGMILGTAALLFITPALYIVFGKLHERMVKVKG